MRSLVVDIIHIYEVNRIECAQLLKRLPDFVLPDVFIPPPPRPAPGQEPEPISGWVLTSTVVNTILTVSLALPTPPHLPIYYTSLLREYCNLDPTKVAASIGQAARNIFALLKDNLDVELARRAAEWLAIHLSNFAYGWIWKEW